MKKKKSRDFRPNAIAEGGRTVKTKKGAGSGAWLAHGGGAEKKKRRSIDELNHSSLWDGGRLEKDRGGGKKAWVWLGTRETM